MNKIISILSLATICVGFAACDEVEESFSKPQTNPQEPLMQVDGLQVAVPEATATAVDLKAYDNGSREGLVPVLDITKLDDFPTNYVIEGTMKIGDDEEFSNSRTIDLVTDNLTLYAPVEEWETAHIALYTKNPRPAKSYVEINLYAVDGAAKVRLMTKDKTFEFGERELTVTPLDAVIPVEDSYSVVVDGTASAMVPSNPDNVYDPPIFTAEVNVPAGKTVSVLIKSASGKVYGISAAEEGALVENGEPLVISQAGPQLLTVNMEKLTYRVSSAYPEIYAYGSDAADGYALSTYDFVTYQGFAGFRGSMPSFRLASEKVSTPAVIWGQAVDDAGQAIEGEIQIGDALEAIALPQAGCYFLNVNISALTYKADFIEYFGLIGSFNGWSTDVVMTSTDRYHMVWTAELTINDGDMFKIRTNGNWDGANLGANSENPSDNAGVINLQEHGADIIWENGSGTFDVTLDLSTMPYTLTAVKK